MRNLLVVLAWAALLVAVAGGWAFFNPDSALVARAADWPWIGPCAQELRRRGPGPDLCFKLRNDEVEPRSVLSGHDALFVECKPVDETHAAGGKYCDDGLCRFVDGD